MSTISRSVLFSKLNPTLYKALQTAFNYCRLRENSYVELVHWLHTLLQDDNNDLNLLIKQFNLDNNQLNKDVLAALERLPTGATSVADFSEHIETAVEQAWTYTSLKFNAQQIRGVYLIYALLKTPRLANVLVGISAEFNKIKADSLEDDLSFLAGSSENSSDTATHNQGNANSSTGDSALKKYGNNLTDKAKQGQIDPIVGRDDEIRQMIDILMRRRQNNPILTGEAGVGKTAVVEALAIKLAEGDVPPPLKDVELVLLDIGLLKAGANVNGEFESRLRAVMDEVESSPKPVILFIDEIHTLIGAGGAAGTGDAANLLKPALARGKLRTIGATTWAEYKKYFEKDPALTRRFQVIQVNEPSEDKAIDMLRALIPSLEAHHQVFILDEAIKASVQLSHRYIPARQLPDKAVSLIDTVCARVALSQHSTPSRIETLQRKILALTTEKNNLTRESKLDIDQQERIASIDSLIAELTEQLTTLEPRWQQERQLIEQLKELRRQILAHKDNEPQLHEHQVNEADLSEPQSSEAQINEPQLEERNLLEQQKQLIAQLKELQQDTPLVMSLVDAYAVADVVSDWTGIPVGKMVKDELQAVLDLDQTLAKRIVDQDHGIQAIAKRIQTSRASLDDPNKPIGVFMLAGPSGVGKTETALALADTLYGGEHNIITINMSEYQEAHTVSTLKGAPPGYVGYGEGGVLTEAVRRKPYSVVLLDEVEKAHPDVHEIFFQVFDKGWMEDGEGRYIDFKNTIIILTTNVGTDLIMDMCDNGKQQPDIDNIKEALREPLLDVFPAALLGRIQVIPYYPLSDTSLQKIVELQLQRIVKRVEQNHGISLNYTEDVPKLIVERCTEVESGGRMIDAILTNTVLPSISRQLLTYMVAGQTIQAINISVADSDFVFEYSE